MGSVKVNLAFLVLIFGISGCFSAVKDKTDVVRQVILDEHNKCRENASPRPNPPLQAMTWDNEMSEYAREWAAEQVCANVQFPSAADKGGNTWGLYISRGRGSPGFYDSDENVKNKARNAIKRACDQRKSYSLSDNSCKGNQQCGGYKQIVWDTSVNIGCGLVVCDTGNRKYSKGYNLVCYYDPPGNVGGKKPYNRAKCVPSKKRTGNVEVEVTCQGECTVTKTTTYKSDGSNSFNTNTKC